MSGAYAFPISAPVEFVNTAANDEILFNARQGLLENFVIDFVTQLPGDLLFANNTLQTINNLSRLAIGTAGQVLTVNSTASQPEITTIQTLTFAGTTEDTYFLINSPTEAFYVWMDKGTGTDPGTVYPLATDLIFGGKIRTGIQADLTGDVTDIDVAASIASAIGAVADFGAVNGGTNTVTVTNVDNGSVVDAADGAAATGFVIAVTQQGSSPLPQWQTPTPGSVDESFSAYVSATGTNTIASGTTFTVLGGSGTPEDNVTWTETHDAGANFDPLTGIFTVPATGLYDISATISFEGNNTGTNGLIAGRRAIRQVRIYNNTAAEVVTFDEEQANSFSGNPTSVNLTSNSYSATANDEISIGVRHDASSALTIDFEGQTGAGIIKSIFTAHRIA